MEVALFFAPTNIRLLRQTVSLQKLAAFHTGSVPDLLNDLPTVNVMIVEANHCPCTDHVAAALQRGLMVDDQIGHVIWVGDRLPEKLEHLAGRRVRVVPPAQVLADDSIIQRTLNCMLRHHVRAA